VIAFFPFQMAPADGVGAPKNAVARIVHYLRLHLVGKSIKSVKAIEDTNVFGKAGTTGPEVAEALTGKKVLSAGSQGKYFWWAVHRLRARITTDMVKACSRQTAPSSNALRHDRYCSSREPLSTHELTPPRQAGSTLRATEQHTPTITRK
jgi:hypothetical protein